MLNILLICLPMWMQGDAQEVQLPPRVRSFFQLAEELRQQGVSVQCAPAVANRLALVCVKPRAWNNLRPLLEKGLEVRFTQQTEGAWRLAADASALSREQTLRNHFARRYEKGVADVLTPAWDAASEMRRFDAEERDRKRKELRDIIGLPGAPGGTFRQQKVAELTLNLEFTDAVHLGLLPLHPLHLAALLPMPALRAEDVLNLAQDSSAIALRLRSSSQAGVTFGLASPLHGFSCLRFSPLTFGITESISGGIEPNSKLIGNTDLVPGTIGRLPFTLRDVFVEAGQGAVLDACEQATNDWLNQVNADKAVSLEAGERTLSAAVQKWSVQNEREVIMEVSPQRDILPGYKTLAPAVTLNMSQALQSGNVPPERAEVASGSILAPEGAALRYLKATPAIETTSLDINVRVWTASQIDGVALLHNQLAFLDNAALRKPDAALLLTQRRARHDNHLNTLDDLLNASRLLSPQDSLLASDSSLYTGIGDYAGAYPFLRFLDTSPQRETIQKELATSKAAYLECRNCSLTAINSLTDAVRSLAALGPANMLTATCFTQNFPFWVRRGVLEIKIESSSFGKGVWATFTLYKSAEIEGQRVTVQPQPLWEATVGPIHDPQTPVQGKEDIKL